MTGYAGVIRGNALALPLADASVDLICTSPPYFGLRSYTDGCSTCSGSPDSYRIKICSGCGETTSRVKCHNGCGVPMRWTKPELQLDPTCPDCGGTGKGHYDGQLGSEATPAGFVDALIAATREMVRVLKPSGSCFVNLGDKYAGSGGGGEGSSDGQNGRHARPPRRASSIPTKSLMGIPWRYALRCIDDLGLILRAEIIWAKPNGLPESVTDRVRRSHETWLHFTVQPRYFSAVDEIREEHRSDVHKWDSGVKAAKEGKSREAWHAGDESRFSGGQNPLGKLPGSVWTIPTQPLTVPPELGVDHFAAFPMEWPRRIIAGWSPAGVCTACGEGRRPVAAKELEHVNFTARHRENKGAVEMHSRNHTRPGVIARQSTTITGYACACPEPTAPTRPSTILDPFGGTGTTALVAKALGRTGISVDMSQDYSRLAAWRTTDPGQMAAALQVERPEPVSPDQLDLFDEVPA